MKLTPQAIALLEATKQSIRKEPLQFQMGQWFERNGNSDSQYDEKTESYAPIPNCGTAACIGGWLVTHHLATTKPEDARALVGDVFSKATEVLSLDSESIEVEQALECLFLTNRWSNVDASAYIHAVENGDNTARAEIACRVIDKFIAEHSQKD